MTLVVSACVLATNSAAAQATDSAVVLGVVQKLFDGMRTKDTALLRAVLIPGTQFVSMRGGRSIRRQSDSSFLASIGSGKEVLEERMWKPTMFISRDLAHVTAPYDFYIDGRFSHCGDDSFTLLRTETGWKVVGLTYTVVTAECPPAPPR